jgi:hypothetical protein
VRVLEYLRGEFQNARFVDPANTSNVISDDLTALRASDDGTERGGRADPPQGHAGNPDHR